MSNNESFDTKLNIKQDNNGIDEKEFVIKLKAWNIFLYLMRTFIFGGFTLLFGWQLKSELFNGFGIYFDSNLVLSLFFFVFFMVLFIETIHVLITRKYRNFNMKFDLIIYILNLPFALMILVDLAWTLFLHGSVLFSIIFILCTILTIKTAINIQHSKKSLDDKSFALKFINTFSCNIILFSVACLLMYASIRIAWD